MRLIDADMLTKSMYEDGEFPLTIADKVQEKIEAQPTANTWIPCSKELPPQPKENPQIDNRPIEIYLVVSEDLEDYPFRAFWNGKIFTDGFRKVDVVAWQSLPEPYKPE